MTYDADLVDEDAENRSDETATSAKELKLFTMCLKKFIKKVFHHMVASKFRTWRELAISEQDGLAYPIYNYVIDADDTDARRMYEGYGLEIEDNQVLLADLAVSAILEEEGSIGLEFYLYETTSIVPYICDNFSAIEDERPDISHFRRINHEDFEALYEELKVNDIFDDLYYELNKSILLIELSEREALAQIKKDSIRIMIGIFARAKSISSLNTITNTDVKECRLDFEADGRQYSMIILNGHDVDNQPVYSSVMIAPEYKSVAQYVDLDTLYEKIMKVLRAKNISDPEELIYSALKPFDRTAKLVSTVL
ncbi:hypothetical protein MASR1M90_06130 [Desulfovibrionales bacterium]